MQSPRDCTRTAAAVVFFKTWTGEDYNDADPVHRTLVLAISAVAGTFENLGTMPEEMEISIQIHHGRMCEITYSDPASGELRGSTIFKASGQELDADAIDLIDEDESP